jgi:hypothetical protein
VNALTSIWRLSLPTLVLIGCAALVAPGAVAQKSSSSDKAKERASKLLERAEAMAQRGSYSAALSTYKKVAKQYPATEAASVARRRATPNAFLGCKELGNSGSEENRVDVVILGDGYTLKHQRSFDRVARMVPRSFERNETLGEYFGYFRFVRANVTSKEDGVDGLGRKFDTALGAFLSDEKRGFLDVDHGQVARMLKELDQHDGLSLVFVRAGKFGFAGHGTAIVGGREEKRIVHEWAHAFAGLGEEHADPERPRVRQPQPANVSTVADPKQVPWKHWIEAGARGIGVYPGADGQLQGAWKPMAAGCVMDEGEFFCAPCREAIVLRIYDFVDPIESCAPASHESSETRKPLGTAPEDLVVESRMDFEVDVMRPKSHSLIVRWYLYPEKSAPEPMGQKGFSGPRSQRGKLPALPGEPLEVDRRRCSTRDLSLDPRRYDAGRYKLVCEVRDETRMRAEPLPWVLRDEQDVLISRRAWWLRIVNEPR